jgi:EAL domain-containing protein (putative c-di-GMP-specific phosphodiesterase class I)
MMMCVNLSMKQLQDPDLGDKVERALRRASLDANKLMLEITETTVVIEDEQHIIGVLRDQCAVGVRIAFDHCHSGFSSLDYVKDLPVDDAIVRLLVDFAHTPGLEVTAEGVENDRQVASLTAMRYDLDPGFIFLEAATQRGSGALVATNPLWGCLDNDRAVPTVIDLPCLGVATLINWPVTYIEVGRSTRPGTV